MVVHTDRQNLYLKVTLIYGYNVYMLGPIYTGDLHQWCNLASNIAPIEIA